MSFEDSLSPAQQEFYSTIDSLKETSHPNHRPGGELMDRFDITIRRIYAYVQTYLKLPREVQKREDLQIEICRHFLYELNKGVLCR